jgi:hypothetical protein
MNFNIVYTENNYDERFKTDIFVSEHIKNAYNLYNQKLHNINNIDFNLYENYFIIVRFFCGLDDVLFYEKNIPIHDIIYQKLNENKNFYIILINDTEPDDIKLVKSLDTFVKENGYDPKQFILVNSNYNLKKRCDLANSEITVHAVNHLDKWIVDSMKYNKVIFIPNKQKLFTCHNRVLKPHRYFLLANLIKTKIINDTDWSLLRAYEIENFKKMNFGNLPNEFYRYYYDLEELNNFKNEMDYLDNLHTKTSDFEREFVFDKPIGDYNETFKINAYQHSYINLTTESKFSYDDVHITEKSLLPMYFYQIPLILGTPKHIESLKERYNFDFFEDIIDLSYDNEYDHKKRFQMYLQQIYNLFENKNSVIELYKKSEDRFKENQIKLLNIQNSTRDEQFFKNLIKLRWKVI